MSRLLLPIVLAVVLGSLSGCGADADAGAATVTPSATIRQATPARGTFDDLVVAYGQGTAASGGTRVLALPLDVTLTGIDVVAGQRVRAGQPLAVFAPSHAAAAARIAARSAVNVARAQRDRIARLLGDRLATNDQNDQAEKTLRDAEATLAAQDTVGAVLRAPADGTVLGIETQRGALVAAGAPLMTFVDSDRVGVVAGIEPVDMARVHPGDPVTLHSLAGDTTLPARVTAVAGVVDPVSRLVDVAISAMSPLVQGATYRADIVVGKLDGWRVPADAVVGDDGERAVWQVVQGKAHRVAVTLLAQRGDDALVAGAIDASLPLVTLGVTQLDEGVQVRPVASK